MKKIYMVSCLMAMLFTFAPAGLVAQNFNYDISTCQEATPNSKVFHLKGSPGPSAMNTLYFTGMPVTTAIRIFGSLGVNGNPINGINGAFPDANGNYSFSYPANTSIPPVFNCLTNTVSASCCLRNVPPAEKANCATRGPINSGTFQSPPGACKILIEVNIGENAQLLDASGNLIPTSEFQLDNGRVQVGDGREVLCLNYPCGAIIGTITACGVTTGCCSRPFTVAGPLPIYLKNFNVSLNDRTINLSWASYAEITSKSFVIEKSTNGKDFSAIGEVEAAGTSISENKYSFADQATDGGNYYRLKMIDLDGQFEYSKVVYIYTGKGKGKISIGPNPTTTGYIQLFGIAPAEILKPGAVRLFSLTGQQVATRVTGANTIKISDSAPKGLYILQVNTETFKIQIQ
jgi:hypothetical protein